MNLTISNLFPFVSMPGQPLNLAEQPPTEDYPGQHHEELCAQYWSLVAHDPSAAELLLQFNHVGRESMFMIM
ncbi:MAG: hypothetical protein ACYCW6_03540 [Candidatus Xenobia bacterium]